MDEHEKQQAIATMLEAGLTSLEVFDKWDEYMAGCDDPAVYEDMVDRINVCIDFINATVCPRRVYTHVS